jgi:hypothetical protein
MSLERSEKSLWRSFSIQSFKDKERSSNDINIFTKVECLKSTAGALLASIWNHMYPEHFSCKIILSIYVHLYSNQITTLSSTVINNISAGRGGPSLPYRLNYRLTLFTQLCIYIFPRACSANSASKSPGIIPKKIINRKKADSRLVGDPCDSWYHGAEDSGNFSCLRGN